MEETEIKKVAEAREAKKRRRSAEGEGRRLWAVRAAERVGFW